MTRCGRRRNSGSSAASKSPLRRASTRGISTDRIGDARAWGALPHPGDRRLAAAGRRPGGDPRCSARPGGGENPARSLRHPRCRQADDITCDRARLEHPVLARWAKAVRARRRWRGDCSPDPEFPTGEGRPAVDVRGADGTYDPRGGPKPVEAARRCPLAAGERAHGPCAFEARRARQSSLALHRQWTIDCRNRPTAWRFARWDFSIQGCVSSITAAISSSSTTADFWLRDEAGVRRIAGRPRCVRVRPERQRVPQVMMARANRSGEIEISPLQVPLRPMDAARYYFGAYGLAKLIACGEGESPCLVFRDTEQTEIPFRALTPSSE